MSNWAAKFQAIQRREEREAIRQQKALERRRKELAKLNEAEQARLEVDEYENTLEVLLSIHKEASARFDWQTVLSIFPPFPPAKFGKHELAARLKQLDPELSQSAKTAIEEAGCSLDEHNYKAAQENYGAEFSHWEKLNSLAKRILAGEAKAYSEAISEFSAFGEIANLGTSINMTVQSPKVVECRLKVNGRNIIPSETKSLTAAGKISVKPMPKGRFHEIYQDHVCGCVLRVAREVLAVLPIHTVLVTATVDGIDTRVGRPAELPVLSVAIPRASIEHLDFQRIDPSDSMENFLHRGDVRMSRKSEDFVAVAPLAMADLVPVRPVDMNFPALLSHLRQCRAEIAPLLKPVTLTSEASSQVVSSL